MSKKEKLFKVRVHAFLHIEAENEFDAIQNATYVLNGVYVRGVEKPGIEVIGEIVKPESMPDAAPVGAGNQNEENAITEDTPTTIGKREEYF
jgi:hypothetical protein